MILYINTAFNEPELAMFSSENLLFYKKWKPQQEALEIAQALKELDLSALQAVLVCEGPGKFTSLRVGVSTAQALAYSLNIALHSFQAEKYLQLLSQKAEFRLQQIGVGEVFVNGERKSFSGLSKEKKVWAGEVKEKHLLPFSWEQETLQEPDILFFQKLFQLSEKKEAVSIFYGKEPSIFS